MTPFSVGLSSNVDALGQLQAQQALQAKRTKNPAPAPAPVQMPTEESVRPSALTEGKASHPLPMDELQGIANRTGFVGLTDRAVQRAYTLGESLFVDYKA